MDIQRTILLVILAFIFLMIWQAWERDYGTKPQPPAKTTAKQTPGKGIPGDVPDVSRRKPGQTGSKVSDEAPEFPTVIKLAKGRKILVKTDLLQVTIDTYGGDIRELLLRQYPVSKKKRDDPFALLSEGNKRLYIVQSGLIGLGDKYPNHKTRYRADKTRYILADGQDTLKVRLYWRAPSGVRYTKVYTFQRDSYVVKVDYEVDNRSRRTWKGLFYGQILRTQPSEDTGFFLTSIPSFTGAVIFTPTEGYEKIDFDELADKTDLAKIFRDNAAIEVTGGWVAMMEHYFVTAWMPPQKGLHRFIGGTISGNVFKIGYKDLNPVTVAAGKRGTLGSSLYAGPKEHDRLEKLVRGMTLTVDFGWLTVLSDPLFRILRFIHSWLGNWGWSIIGLTVLIKLLFFPLSAKSYKSMAKMKKVAPKIKSLKESFGKDKQRMQQEMMKLYKAEKINPFGGCLPILIQIPVFIALYWVLLESVELRQAPFILWLDDLSARDPYFVLPVLMGASMWAQHHLNPTPMDPTQEKLMKMLPILFTFLFLFFPSGLVLYWLVNNVLSIAQQWQITRMLITKGH